METQPQIIPLEEVNFRKVIFDDNAPSIITVRSDWSGQSQLLMNVLARLVDKYQHLAKFYTLEINSPRTIAKDIVVEEIPTTFFVRNGEIIDCFTGVLSKQNLDAKIKFFFTK